MMRIVDVLYGLPFIIFIILLMVIFGRNLWLLFGAIGAVEWLTMARIVRGQVIGLKNQEFVLAAKAMGIKLFNVQKTFATEYIRANCCIRNFNNSTSNAS